MSWWGGSKKEDPAEKGFSDGSADFADSGPNLMQHPSGSSGSGGGSGMAEFQQFSVGLQQQVLVQQVITELTHTAFQKCCSSSKRDSQLTGKEVACIHAATNKWLDSNEFLMGRIAKKQQQQAASQSFH